MAPNLLRERQVRDLPVARVAPGLPGARYLTVERP
jgi:hypothetical protein